MADARKVTIDTEAAARLIAPIKEAATEGGAFGRTCDLEHALVKTRDALRVISRGLEDVAERHASAEALELTQEDVSTLYGAVTLIEYVADECDHAYWRGARA